VLSAASSRPSLLKTQAKLLRVRAVQVFREEVLGPRIAEIQEEITLLKKEAVRLMKDVGDKPAALDALRRAKQMEVELAELQK
jgi:hypothetical protein